MVNAMEKLCYGCMRKKSKGPVCEHCGYDERMQNDPNCLPRGIVLQRRYLIGRTLDLDYYYKTYLGWDILEKRRVVVKEYYPAPIAAREQYGMNVLSFEKGGANHYDAIKQLFIEEIGAKNMAYYDDGIAQVYGFFEENNTAYVLSEYVDGINLRKYVKSLGRPMLFGEVVDTVASVVNGFWHSDHMRPGCVHWEINPDNLIMQPNGKLKLINFGDGALKYDPNIPEIETAKGPMVLTNGFTPLELYMVRGKRGTWTDVYGLCATIYWCMTGVMPAKVPERIVEDTLDWSLLKDLPYESQEALKKGMALKVSDRFQTVRDFWDRFTACYHTIP